MNARTLLALICIAGSPAAAHATDISGLWEVTTTVAQGPVRMDCSLLQVGVVLSGWCEPESADAAPAAVQGQLDRTRATWEGEMTLRGQPVRVAYDGSLSADRLDMSGTLTAGASSAPFTAARK